MNKPRNKKILLGLPLFIVLLLWGYSSVSFFFSNSSNAFAQDTVTEENSDYVVKVPPPLEKTDETQPPPQPQTLQVSEIKVLTSVGKALILRVEIAQTNDERRMGMMYRSSVPAGTGMLFLFDESQERSFWMKNTWVPLDIIFIQEDGTISNIQENAVPLSLDRINSEGDVRDVLEIGGGEVQRLGIAAGDKVIYE